MKSKRCLVPGCKTIPRSRGLCWNHYMRARLLVLRERVTWDELVSQGKALASTRDVGRTTPSNEWFLNSCK